MNAGTRRGRILLALFAVVALACVSASVSASGGKPRTPIPKAKLKVSPLKLTRVFQSAKSVSGRIAQSDPALLGRSDSTPVNVLIKYDVDPTASYDGGVNGLAPTSPEATGKPLASNRSAVNAYTSYANTVIQKTSNAVQSAASNVRITRSFTAVYGGVAARLPANQVGSVLGVKGVVAVQEDSRQQPSTSVTPQFIGATAVWPSLGGLSKAGDGVVIGVIDSGIWPEHPSFADNAGLSPPKGSYACQFGQAGHPDLGPAFACNKKLIGAYAFTDTYQSVFPDEIGPGQFCDAGLHVCSARDSDGHGSNIAAIAAGDPVAGAPLYGVDRGPISGMAPGAKIIAYRVCLDQGCFDSDSIEAIEQAITDGVDVINYSISGDPNPYTDPVELAFLDAFHAGISVMASGGNDGPESGTVEHGGPWVTTAGASTSPRQLFTTTLHLRADGGASFDKPGVTITGGVSSPTPVVLAGSLGDPRCLNPFAPKSVTGKIVACERGGILRIDKSFNVKQGGAAGIIVYNTTQTDLALDNYWVPGIQLNAPNDDLTTFISTHKNVTATWAPATPTPGTPDVMASFSSRGPSTDFIKPDVTAPGVSILAAETPRPYPDDISLGPPGQLYQVISGTSMASPHVAGSAALIKAAHPDWTPAEIKSALMTSAVQDVVKEDGSTPADPFDDGSGSIRVNRAVNPTLVFNEEFRHFVHSIDHPLGRIDLNLPSIDAPVMPGLVTTDRTAINVSGADQMLDVSTSAPSGATITVDSDNGPLRVAKGAKVKFRVTISAPSLADGQYFGSIMLTPRGGGTPVYIPVAFTKQQGAVSLQASCDPTSFKVKTGHSHCTVSAANTDAAPAQVSVTVMNATPQDQLTFSNVTTSGQQVHNDASGLRWSGTLRPALAPPIKDVSKVGPANYLSLSGLGVPNLGLGDETMGVIDGLPAYTYGMEVYTQLGIDSNGYLVVGDASDADNDSVPQTFPDSSVPNNVLAPYWTDLDASQPGAYVGAAILDDGSGNQWIVVDYENVPIYGTGTKESFEVWIASTTIGEVITYDYPTGGITGAGGPDGLNVGAENRDGSSGINVSPVPSGNSEYLVTAGAPQAGGSVTIQFDASSTRVGQNSLLAQMASNLTPGLTQQQETLTVIP